MLVLSLREWARTRRCAASHIGHGFDWAITTTCTTEQSATSKDRRNAIDLASIREDLSRPQMFQRWIDGKAQVADALTKLRGDGDLLRAVCRQAFTVLVEAPEIMAARRQESRDRENVPRVKSPLKLREPVGETSMPVTPTPTVT